MFHHQATTPNKLKHLELYENWKKENPDLVDNNKRNYIDSKFFEFVALEYQQNGTYKEEFGSCIDLIIRHNMASHQWLVYPDLVKSDLYSNATFRCFEYAIRTWDVEKGSAFVYFNSAIKNGFKEVINSKNKESNKVKKLQCPSNIDSVIGNVKPSELSGVQESFYDKTITSSNISGIQDEIELQFYLEMKSTFNEVLKEMNYHETSMTYGSLKILVEDNVPRFKRKYITFNNVLPLDFNEIHSTKRKSPRIEIKRGICVEYIDQRDCSERAGQNKNLLQTKAILSRRDGHQFFGVFSSQWKEHPETVKLFLRKLIYNMITEQYQGRNLLLDCIAHSQIQKLGANPPSFYLLKDDYSELHLCTSQSVNDYMTWLDENKDASRIFDAGNLKAVGGIL